MALLGWKDGRGRRKAVATGQRERSMVRLVKQLLQLLLLLLLPAPNITFRRDPRRIDGRAARMQDLLLIFFLLLAVLVLVIILVSFILWVRCWATTAASGCWWCIARRSNNKHERNRTRKVPLCLRPSVVITLYVVFVVRPSVGRSVGRQII